jgi:outer membrane protein assembly factor BamB
MNRLVLVSLVALAAIVLSACGSPGSSASWPGLTADAEQAYLASGSFVYAIRLSDGAKAWQYPDKAGPQHFYAPPVLTPDGQLLVGSAGTDGGLTSLDPESGQTKWAAPFLATDHWVASPLVVQDTIYAANNNGTLYALDLGSGRLQWSLPLGSSLWGAPITNGKLIFATSLDHRLYAVDPVAHKLAWKLDLGGSAASGASVSADGTTVFVGSFAKKVLGVEAASGRVRWTADVSDWVWGTPAVDGDSVYAADLSGGIFSLGAPNGKNAWPVLQPDGPITASPVVLPNGILVATESGTVFAYDRTGSNLWEAVVGGKIYTTPAVSGDRIAVAPLNADFLLAALSPDGKLVWKFTGK